MKDWRSIWYCIGCIKLYSIIYEKLFVFIWLSIKLEHNYYTTRKKKKIKNNSNQYLHYLYSWFSERWFIGQNNNSLWIIVKFCYFYNDFTLIKEIELITVSSHKLLNFPLFLKIVSSFRHFCYFEAAYFFLNKFILQCFKTMVCLTWTIRLVRLVCWLSVLCVFPNKLTFSITILYRPCQSRTVD